MTSPFVRATCGCVVLPLRERVWDNPRKDEVVVVWNCQAGTDDPYGFSRTSMEGQKVAEGRPLTDHEQADLCLQLSKRLLAATQLQCIMGALQMGQELNVGRTDASPAREG